MLAGVALVALVLSAWFAGRSGRVGAAVLGVCSLAWLALDHSMEGSTLWAVSSSHGLVAADLAGLAGLGLAVVLWVRHGGH